MFIPYFSKTLLGISKFNYYLKYLEKEAKEYMKCTRGQHGMPINYSGKKGFGENQKLECSVLKVTESFQ